MSDVTINGQRIPWSFIQSIRKHLGGDWDRTIDALHKARNAEGKNGIIKYLTSGLRKENPFVFVCSPEREKNGMKSIMAWWTSTVHKPKRAPSSVGEILRGMAGGAIVAPVEEKPKAKKSRVPVVVADAEQVSLF